MTPETCCGARCRHCDVWRDLEASVMAQMSLGELGGIVLAPDTLEEQRGAWCSPREYTTAAVASPRYEPHGFRVDPFTNPRSTLNAQYKCMLERGDDGFGLARRDVPGTFYINPENCVACGGRAPCGLCGYHVADSTWEVWIQPDYEFVQDALDHYGHTRYVALLRADTSTKWFEWLFERSEVIMVPRRDRLEFVPPPGVKASSNPYPHGVYYRHAEDVTTAIFNLCFPWPTRLYPWSDDPLRLMESA